MLRQALGGRTEPGKSFYSGERGREMRLKIFLGAVLASLIAVGVVAAGPKNDFQVKPGEFEPEKTPLVNGAWLNGIGCPTNAKTAQYNSTFTSTMPGPAYTDAGCPTGDDKDKKVEGLLLAKTGPTTNAAAAGAEIKGVKGQTISGLGWDIRKPGFPGGNGDPGGKLDDRGSHCGAGAPRFNIQTDTAFYFVGCQQMSQTATGVGWVRLRITGAAAGIGPNEKVQFMEIIFDEGQDTGPDNF